MTIGEFEISAVLVSQLRFKFMDYIYIV